MTNNDKITAALEFIERGQYSGPKGLVKDSLKALAADYERLIREENDAAKWQCPTCADRISESNRQEAETQELRAEIERLKQQLRAGVQDIKPSFRQIRS